MILQNLIIAHSPEPVSVAIEGGVIRSVRAGADDQQSGLFFEEAIAFPGLINSHDHLDFNSFPLLGNEIYTNYVAWGADIHQNNKEEIDAVLRIPKNLRVQWSLYKNLLNGITTVVQHGEHFEIKDELIRVFQNCHSIHSVRLEKGWKLRLNKIRKDNWPIVLHIGEGTDEDARKEIDELIRWNLLHKKLVGIHGVAMTAQQAKSFRALIWCPDSNYFLLKKTADIAAIKKVLPVIFGTDSTLTAHWSIWEQLRIARCTELLTDAELFDALTITPAGLWELENSGKLAPGYTADIVVARKKASGFMDAFYSLTPEDILLVIREGNILLYDETLYKALMKAGYKPDGFSPAPVNNAVKYTRGNPAKLMSGIRDYYPGIAFP